MMSVLNLLACARSPSAPSLPSLANWSASSRPTTTFSNGWFALISFFISASIRSKSSGVMRCESSTS